MGLRKRKYTSNEKRADVEEGAAVVVDDVTARRRTYAGAALPRREHAQVEQWLHVDPRGANHSLFFCLVMCSSLLFSHAFIFRRGYALLP